MRTEASGCAQGPLSRAGLFLGTRRQLRIGKKKPWAAVTVHGGALPALTPSVPKKTVEPVAGAAIQSFTDGLSEFLSVTVLMARRMCKSPLDFCSPAPESPEKM